MNPYSFLLIKCLVIVFDLWLNIFLFSQIMFSNGIACNLPFSCMNIKHDTGSDELLSKIAREPIILNVYDMYWINEYTNNIGLGVFHSGLFKITNPYSILIILHFIT